MQQLQSVHRVGRGPVLISPTPSRPRMSKTAIVSMALMGGKPSCAHTRGCGRPLMSSTSMNKPIQYLVRSRPLTVRARADASSGNDDPLYLPATASTYAPFSAELLLATTRLAHLERYREEVQQLYEPGQPVELTRVALLISNIYQPQLDHRPYFNAMEHLVAAAALAVMRRVSTANNLGVSRVLDDSCAGFEGLDIRDPVHVLSAVQAINELLFVEEGLGVNAADPYDPLNGSLADLLDTRKGNQWTLAVTYLHILDGLGLPCAVVGSPERIFVRVGQPPALVHDSDSDSNIDSSIPPVFLADMSQPGVVYAYPPPVPAAPVTGSASSSSGTVLSALRPAHSVPADAGSLSSTDSSSDSSTGAEEWNRALHAFLQQHRDRVDSQAQHSAEDPTQGAGGDDAAADMSDTTSSSTSGRDDEFVFDDEATTATSDASSSSWLEVQAYAAQDAATRNSWKALYGPGALTEWGGLVSNPWQQQQYQQAYDAYMGGGSSLSGGGGDDGASIGGMRAGEWLGVLDSPFARAAHEPLPGDGVDEDSSSSSFSSMDTGCGSPVGSLGDDEGVVEAVSDVDMVLTEGSGSSWGAEAAQEGGGGGGGGAADAVLMLTWADVAAIGGLQPVTKRVMLQQLLGGMKLSLMMSGRQEELLMVLRYLRATDPFSLPDLRDTALCLAEQRPEEAAPLLREYLAVAPGAPDADMVAEVLAQVQLRVQLGRAKGWQ